MAGAKRILHFAFTTDPPAAAKAREALEAFCLDRAYPAPAPEAKQHRIELLPAILRWEHHGEFMTYSWSRLCAGSRGRAANPPPRPAPPAPRPTTPARSW
ncbi:MAG: DUF3422 family protein [Bryobacteraceae bacterium]